MEKQNRKEKMEKELKESLADTDVTLRTIQILASFQDWFASQNMTHDEFDMVFAELRKLAIKAKAAKDQGLCIPL